MPQAGSPSTNGVAAPAAAKAPQNRTKPFHFCMASMLVLLDLRALFILITIYPWCFPSFLRSGKTPTKIVWSWGTPTKGDSFGETLGDWPPEFWAILFFQLGISFRIKPSTFAPLHHHCVTTEPSTLMDAVILTISKNYLMMWHVWIKLDGYDINTSS